MTKKNNLLLFNIIIGILLLHACTVNNNNTYDGLSIDFKDQKQIKASEIIFEYKYVKLETSNTSLFGSVNQIEIFQDRIYILDRDKTHSIFIFSIDGRFITKLEGTGNGPGEFILPHSFKIEKKGYLYVLDRTLNKLLKYRLNDLKFEENIILPSPSPLSFSILQNENLFIYHYPLRFNDALNKKLFVIADKRGEIVKSFHDGSQSDRILHGNPNNIYDFEGETRLYPYFSNKIYKVENDSLSDCYNLFWGKHTLPDIQLFTKNEDSNLIMKEIITGEKDWIRLLYIYETKDLLVVKYYIKKDFYLSYWNKNSKKIVNTKAIDIIDDLGLGEPFPLPIGLYDQKFIGIVNPFDLKDKLLKNNDLQSILRNTSEDSNPILIFYNIK